MVEATVRMGRVDQPVLPFLPAEARSIGPSAGLLEGPEGGVVFVFGLATFTYAAGDGIGRRLAAVQLVATKAASATEVASAFRISTVTLWRWKQDFTTDGVAGLVPTRTGPRGPLEADRPGECTHRGARRSWCLVAQDRDADGGVDRDSTRSAGTGHGPRGAVRGAG